MAASERILFVKSKEADQLDSLDFDNPKDWHGHVRPRPDGIRMRCGGERLCSTCRHEAALLAEHAQPVNLTTTPVRADEPTRAQAEAGNYAKRALPWRGLTIRIENEAGSVRRGTDPGGKAWETHMPHPYGYIVESMGVDGDPVDVYVGPFAETAEQVFVVHQRRVGDWDKFDEDKAFIGFLTEDDARQAFLQCYDDPRFLGPITAMPVAEFVAKVRATKKAPRMIKARVGPYIRLGRLVNLAGYDGRQARAQAAADQAALFSDTDAPVLAPKKADLARYDHTNVGDLFEQAQTAPVRQTDTPQFREWFGASKVVDSNGNPLVLYHGTGADFGEFKFPKKSKSMAGLFGHFFTSDSTFAEKYGKVVMPVYLSIKNPKVVSVEELGSMQGSKAGERDRKWAIEDGYDGAVTKDGKVWIAFDPHQIKSAIGNNGDFSKDSPVITKAIQAAGRRRVLFMKTHVSGYVNSKGTFVAAHEDSRIKHPSEDKGWLGADMADAIRGHMESDPAATFGLRVIPRGFEARVGDELPPSKRWEDGEDTGEELRGTSTIGVTMKNVDHAIRTLERAGYSGDQIALVAGDSAGFGEDDGERLISEAKVVAVWRRGNKMTKSHPILFLKAKHRGDDRTADMFGTHLETRTRKDGVVQGYQVANVKKDAALDAAISHLKEDAKQGDLPKHEQKEDAALVAKLEEARGASNDTAARRKAALAVLGDDWRSTPDGKKDAYKRSVKLADGGRYEVMIKPARTVAGNFYVGSYFHGGKRSGPGNAVDHPKTLEEAKAVAEGWIAKVEPVKPAPAEDLEKFIKVAADSIGQLRKVDVLRVLESNGSRKVELANYITDKRPDLAQEVAECMEDIGVKDWRSAPAKRDGQADYKAAVRSTKQGPDDDNPRRKFYVTIAREGRGVALLAGPFDTHDEAKQMVDRAKEKAYEVDPRSHFDAFGTSGVESDNHKPGVLNDQLGLGVLQPAPSDDSHPAPTPRIMLNDIPEGQRERWKGLHREQHELRYWHLPKLRKEMDRHQGAINRALEEYNEHKAIAQDPLMKLDTSRAAAHQEAADKAFKRYQSALAKKDAGVAEHQKLHARMTALGKEKDKILPKSGDLDFAWAAQRYRDTAEQQDMERSNFKTYSEHYKPAPRVASARQIT